MALDKRLSRLTEEAFEAEVEKRLEEEFTEMLELLEERLPRETFLEVVRIAASGERPSGRQ